MNIYQMLQYVPMFALEALTWAAVAWVVGTMWMVVHRNR
jgi:hypothetical protein